MHFCCGEIKQGFVHGKSDERAHYVEENGVDVPSINATIAYAMGLSIEKITYSLAEDLSRSLIVSLNFRNIILKCFMSL